MKMILFLVFVIINSPVALCQVSQKSIGTSGVTERFIDAKLDPTDGGIINVGYINLGTGNSNDLFFVKLNASHQIVWQKTIANAGDDIFYKVIICANGDYVAAGQIFQSGIRRGIACRINSTTGDLIWSKVSANSAVGEFFWNLSETSNNNIALVGTDHFDVGQTNSFITLLNSGGSNLWSNVSTTADADEFRTVSQLPNGNLIVGGFYNPNAFNYPLTIVEINETTGAIINQSSYETNTTVPGNPFTLNSLWPLNIFIRNSTVLFEVSTFQGFGSSSEETLMTYDQTSKNLDGNIYYHTGVGILTADCIFPVSENDFLLSLSSAGPTEVFISRITNGVVAYDNRINSNVSLILSIDTAGSNAAFAGGVFFSDDDAFNLFSPLTIPTSSTPCDISDASRLNLQTLSLTPTGLSPIAFTASTALADITLTSQTPTYTITNVCGLVPVTLLNLNGTYNPTNQSVLLNWSTASEMNSKLFDVERSIDKGKNYFSIGTVNAKGTSNSIVNYQMTDKNPVNGTNLYRLKQIDLDGKFHYSDVVSVNVKLKGGALYSIYPVPAHHFTYVRSMNSEAGISNIAIIDATGKIVYNQKTNINNSHEVKLDLASIPAGIYFIKIFSETNQTFTQKLLVE